MVSPFQDILNDPFIYDPSGCHKTKMNNTSSLPWEVNWENRHADEEEEEDTNNGTKTVSGG